MSLSSSSCNALGMRSMKLPTKSTGRYRPVHHGRQDGTVPSSPMMCVMTKRTPTGAAVLQPQVTSAITEAVLDELALHGYGRLSMEAVAKRAEVGKSALYRR